MKERIEIVASGFGGQGVVRLGQILGQAAVKQGFHVTMLKSHGTEMRGGYVRSQVVLSPELIDSPICESPDYFIALSLAAYNRFKDTVPGGGVILYDPAFVDTRDDGLACKQVSVPAKRMSVEHFSQTIFANTIILGALARNLEFLDKDVLLESVLEIITKFHPENREAFQVGYDCVQ